MSGFFKKYWAIISAVFSSSFFLFILIFCTFYAFNGNKYFIDINISFDGSGNNCHFISPEKISDIVSIRSNRYIRDAVSEKKDISGFGSLKNPDKSTELLHEYYNSNSYAKLIGYISSVDVKTIEIILHIDEKCNPTRYEVFTTDFQATSGLSGLNYVDEISKGVISASDEYYSLYNTSKFDTDFVRQRALANIAENRDLKWYTNLIGITYAADRKKLTDEKNSRKLLEKALFWFTESLKYDKTFFPAMANKIDAEIILDNYSDNSFDAGAKELLNTYYMYPGKGYIGYAGILYYEEVFGINGGNVTINKQKLNKIQLSRDFIEREISLYGGNSDLYGTLSRIYGFFGKADTKEKYDYLIKSQSSSRRL